METLIEGNDFLTTDIIDLGSDNAVTNNHCSAEYDLEERVPP
jgi:hypothetical protein